MLIQEAVATFLRKMPHNNPDLVDWWSIDLETQIYVSPLNGHPVEDKRNTWSDGKQTWHHIRWPRNAMAEAYYKDRPITFSLVEHADYIGTTGWNWTNRESWHVAYDFDDLTSHAPGVGVDEQQLEQVKEKAIELPYVDVIRSTGGKGLHLYIRFDRNNAPKTKNHSEHAALARALLGKMSTDTGFDFGSHLDVCGSIIWIWGRKMTPENKGYTWIKKAQCPLTADTIPPNWKDHLDVISNKTSKVRVIGFTENKQVDEQDELTELTSARVKYQVTDAHKAIIDNLEQSGFASVWVPDHHLLQTHTTALKQVFNQGNVKGYFDTLSRGTEPTKPNCLAGNTMIITREGVKPIRSLAGKTATIITLRGKWVKVPFKSYGKQNVFAITLKQRNQTKVIHATKDHRWFVYRYSGKRIKHKVNFGNRVGVCTEDLIPGQILMQTKPRGRGNIQPGVVGIQHGLVWGDGTNGGERTTSELPLFGKKDAELLKFFAEHPRRLIKHSIGGTLITNLPYHFKSLVPLHYDKTYLYGWLAGYFAADGHMTKTGSCIIRSSNKKSIEHVRQVCYILGIETSQITEVISGNGSYKPGTIIYTTCLKAADLTEKFFLLSEHRSRFNSASKSYNYYWRVVSVEPASQEEVFCCTVPETGCFCLEDFILTGNCFAIPGPRGSFTVYRFGKGTPENRLWNQDNKGWTWIKYNAQPNLRTAALAMGGKEEERGGYIFDDTEKAKKTVEAIGSKLLLPEENDYTNRETKIGKHKDGRLIVELEKKDGDRGFDDDWLEKRGGKWFRIYNINTNLVEEERDYAEYDSLIRSVRTPSNVAAGWAIRAGGVWVRSPREDVRDVLKAYNQMVDTTLVMGQAILNQWTLVNLPFQDELPGGRQWNYGAAQFKYKPAELDVNEQPSHPHWDLILSHLGTDLDRCIRETEWCKKWNINSGKDYLIAWIACCFREPFEPLPYLFFYGDYECGKSTLHEALGLLVTGGVVKADTAIVNQGDFNGELANGVLAVIDEKNIAAAGPQVYNKLKEWCTGLTISIHRKRTEVYQQPNTLHFLQFANDRDACPVFPGDTRIVVTKVGPLIEEIPKRLLMKKLEEEAEHFMATLMGVLLPESLTRLRLPLIETETKRNAMVLHRNPLETFIDEQCFHKLGRFVTMKDFYERFSITLNPYEKQTWTKSKIRRNMPDIYPIGRYSGNSLSVGNLSFDDVEIPDKGPYFISHSNKLKLAEYGTEAGNVQDNSI